MPRTPLTPTTFLLPGRPARQHPCGGRGRGRTKARIRQRTAAIWPSPSRRPARAKRPRAVHKAFAGGGGAVT